MKLLIIYADKFGYKTTTKGWDDAQDRDEEKVIEGAVAGFIQVEAEDVPRTSEVETKLIKQLKWSAKKNGTNKIILHSFAHLSHSKAPVDTTIMLFNNAEKRLSNSGYEVFQTPFGYFLDLDIKAPGNSFARIFKDI